MFIQELKKKNYFRYFQLSSQGRKINDQTILFFLLEAELTKIFLSISDPILKKIRYQWFIEELKKKKSNHFLINNILRFENRKIYLLIDLVVIYSKFDYEKNITKQWRKNFKDIHEIYDHYFETDFLKTSILFLFCFFIYKSKISSISSELMREIRQEFNDCQKETNIFERTFLEIFVHKFTNINKIEFLVRYCINKFRYK